MVPSDLDIEKETSCVEESIKGKRKQYISGFLFHALSLSLSLSLSHSVCVRVSFSLE